MRRMIAAAALAALAAAAASAPAARPATAPCAPGVHARLVHGHVVQSFCGRAKALVRLGGRTVRFAGGRCQRRGGLFAVNIGTSIADASFTGRRPAYFGLTAIGTKAGVRPSPTIALVTGGKAYALTGTTATLAPGLAKGTFAGTVALAGTKVSGSFTC